MNLTLAIGLWRQRLASPVRVVILGLLAVLPPTLMALVPGMGLAALSNGYPIAMVFAVGMIGQDVSSGVLQLVLARPVTRSEYVFSRWLAAGLGASAVSLAQVGLGWALVAIRHSPPDPRAMLLFAAGREFEIFGVVAVMALLSSLMGGLGDLALYVVLNVVGGIMSMVGQFQHVAAVSWLGQELGALLSPHVELAQIVAGTPSWSALAAYASNLTLCLLVAVLVMNRKELSYASG